MRPGQEGGEEGHAKTSVPASAQDFVASPGGHHTRPTVCPSLADLSAIWVRGPAGSGSLLGLEGERAASWVGEAPGGAGGHCQEERCGTEAVRVGP